MKSFYTFIIAFIITLSIANSQRWKEVETIPAPFRSNYWLDVFFHPSNPSFGWVCGFNGMVVRTTDGGNTWAGSLVPGADHLEHIHFPTLNVGYTSGPEGIYKSINGGNTWVDVTPDPFFNYWGCYFVNENVGFVIGGGCVEDQHFFRTTNGGSTWTLFTGSAPNSGLTDLIVYDEIGLGYAASSGNLWHTLDGGLTWSVLASTGSNIWHEEITNIGSSFLVPYAGTTCQGQGGDGGMRFTTDMGSSWNNYSTGVAMFGSFLINANTGWVCGDNRNVLQTTDGGLTWKNKNCGIKQGVDLDDIWFVNSQLGYVVGRGIYKLSATDFLLTKDTLLFDNICALDSKLDSLIMEHYSFESSLAEFDIIDNVGNHFELISPNSWLTLASCDITKIIVRFFPKDDRSHTARLRVVINPDTPDEIIKYVELIGNVIKPTAFPQDTLLVLDRLVCNTSGNISVPWFVDNPSEFIVQIDKLYNSNYINYNSGLPFTFKPPVSNIGFSIQLPDTGWYQERFRFNTMPCNKDTSITVRAYGISPIISHSSKSQLNSNCFQEVLDTIRVYNTGNINLDISSLSIVPAISEFKIVGWISGNTPISIPKNDSADLVVSYLPSSLGTHQADLVLINNDSTKLRGNKNPYKIGLKGVSQSIILDDSLVVDFGDICLGQTQKLNSRIHNTGNLDAILQVSNLFANVTVSLVDINNRVRKQDSVTLNITIDAINKGLFNHVIKIESNPCNVTTYLVIKGRVVSNELDVIPDLIQQTIKVGESYNESVSITSLSDININVKSIKLDPPTSDWNYSYSPNVPILLLPGQGVNFDFEFSPVNASNYKGRIVIESDGLCKETYYVDLDLSSFNRMVVADKESIDLLVLCDKENSKLIDVIVQNLGFSSDTITSVRIDPDSEVIKLNLLGNLPILQPQEKHKFTVEIAFGEEGVYNATLIIETKGDDGQVIRIPIRAEYRESDISPLSANLDYGLMEKCSESKIMSVEFINNGSIDDTLIYVEDKVHPVFEIIGGTWPVPAGSRTTIEFRANSDKFDNFGVVDDVFSLSSTVCYISIPVKTTVNVVKPMLQIIPDSFTYEDKWADETKSATFDLRNIGEVDLKIDDIILNDELNFKLLNSPIGKTIQVGEATSFEVEFIRDTTGLSSETISVKFSSLCIDSTDFNVSGSVLDEKYSNLIYIGNYEANAGDSIIIDVKLRDGFDRLEADRIDFRIEFDRRLFYPLGMSVRSNNRFDEISYSYQNGAITGFVDDNYSKNLLKQSGDLFKIHGIVLASIPDNTDLIISQFDVTTSKSLALDKQNGHLQLINYCEETVGLSHYAWLPWFRINSGSIAYFGNFSFEINTTSDIPVNYRITDVMGNVQKTGIMFPGRAYSKETIELNSLSSGNYFIIFETKYQSEIINIINIK